MSELIAIGIIAAIIVAMGIMLYRERAANITLKTEKSITESQKEASDRDVEKYRHEAEIHSQPPLRGAALADAFRSLRDKAKRG